MSSFRFIHTADIHLDSPMRGLSDEVPGIAERLRLATREALTALVDAAIERAVDFVVIAGDVYDGDWRDYQTGVFFARQMHRLAAASIPVYLIHGNHDAQNQMTRSLSLPDNVQVFSHEAAETRTLDGLDVALHGMSYARREVTDNLVPGYPEPAPGVFNIGLLHTALGGRDGHANYAPCTLDELTAKGYDYWALGHVHSAEVLAEHPHVVFSGNLQGRSIRETGAKSAFEVGVEDGRVVALQPIYCDVARWAERGVDVADADDFNDVIAAMRRAIEAGAADVEGRLLAIRLRLTGTTALHDRLTAAPERLLAEARAAAAGLGSAQVYVEKIKLATEPELDAASRRARQDALGEMQRLLVDAADDPDIRAMIEKDIRRLAERLPHDIRADADDPLLRAAIDGDTATLIDGAGAYLLARLAAGETPS
ncbi:DNA repair exonuclease [Salinisphaera sp. LB1]|uniref:metallophosphoesterase family protein n=1 Tax=Salinisphaera sp. LB1 TaxID=2183911 RepID=UPI000D70874F|nr:DNA repair exonuclease [Salinisphaera sp. LB1]AWN16743.1 DNA repair exonuclease family protein YhaO [Salinisphaera sp. LB1]